jgi:hypothetical protein
MARRRHVTAFAIVAAAVAVRGAAAQPLEFTRQDVASYAGARGLTAADFDRDGWIDLAQANTGRNSVTVLINQRGSARSFVAVYDIPVGLGPFDITTADFNRDGIADLAVANADGHTISILLGQAAGGFSRTDIAAPSGPRGISTADLNKDGRDDLVVSGWNVNTVQVLYGTGSGSFTSGPTVSGLPSHPQGLAVADFNHDGRLDVVGATESSAGLALMSGHASGGFTAAVVSGASSLNVLATGDLNRDGWMDVAAASSGSNRVAVYLGSASGLRFHRTYATGASPRGVLVRDIDYDGMPDVVTANRSGNSISVLRGNPAAAGTLLAAESFASGAGSRALAAADFDRDGGIDVVTGNQDAPAASVLWNDTRFDTAAFGFKRLSLGTPSTSSGGSAAVPADFNEDGKLDVVVRPDYTVGRVIHVILTDGPTVALDFPQYFGGYTVADLNKDGHADVLVADGEFETLLLWPYLGDGRGGFTRAPELRMPISHWELTIGDLTGDAAPDIAVVSHDRSIGSYFVQMLIGHGDGTFTPGTRVNTSSSSTFTAAPRIVDVNRDGKRDLAVFSGGTLTVFYGDGTGNLQPGSASVLSSYELQLLVLADLNHDDLLDAVVGEQGRLRIAMGTATGFSAPVVITTPIASNWSYVAVEDIDLDGQPDIIGGAGFIMRGRGDGTFDAFELFDWDSPIVHIADFNRDGLPDLVMPTTSGAFDVILNQRGHVNHAPTVNAGQDRTIEYAEQFAEEPPALFAIGADADLHRLNYQWRDQAGHPVGWDSPYLSIEGLSDGTYTFTVTVTDDRGGSATDSVNVTIAPTKEIVLWAANGFYNGTFSEVDDATAAGGQRGYDENLGRPKVTTPSTNPPNRITLSFVADPSQTYKLWVRLKAAGNHWSNDSIWVQFSGSTDAQGNPMYRYGTTSGLEVNLEECAGCGVSGWGWEDDGWGAVNKNGVTLRFPQGGGQWLVIQTREDGVSIDQVVLSSEKYLTTRPGAPKNDTKILPFTFWQFEG